MVYPNTRASWLTRQLDLELMFTSTISLRTANWIKWEKLFTDLVTLSTGSTYSLDLCIRFGNLIYSIWWLYLLALFSGFIYSMAVFILLDGSVYWTYLLDLFYGFTYSLDLFIRFGGFTYSPYLWTLVSVHTVFMLIANLVSFSHNSERNTNKFPSICISHVLMEKTGQLVSTPLEALRLEADVQSYSTCSKRLILKANEKARRTTDDHPKRIALNVNIPQRLQSRSSFRRKAEELSSLLPPDLQHRENIIHFPSPPWQQCYSHTGRISTSVPGINSRADDNNIKR